MGFQPRSTWFPCGPGGRKALTPGAPGLTLNPMPPFLQHRQASMRAMTVNRPEKDTATTAREDDQESSLSGAPSAAGESSHRQPLKPAHSCAEYPQVCSGASHAPASGSPVHSAWSRLSTSTLALRPHLEAQHRWT